MDRDEKLAAGAARVAGDALAAQAGRWQRERRERIAAQVLAGLVSADPKLEYEQAAYYAVGHADALIQELDK